MLAYKSRHRNSCKMMPDHNISRYVFYFFYLLRFHSIHLWSPLTTAITDKHRVIVNFEGGKDFENGLLVLLEKQESS